MELATRRIPRLKLYIPKWKKIWPFEFLTLSVRSRYDIPDDNGLTSRGVAGFHKKCESPLTALEEAARGYLIDARAGVKPSKYHDRQGKKKGKKTSKPCRIESMPSAGVSCSKLAGLSHEYLPASTGKPVREIPRSYVDKITVEVSFRFAIVAER